MNKQEKALFAQLSQAISDLKNPANNPAQNFLTTEAMAGADALKRGDYSNLPKGMFFDFKSPVEQMKQYDQLNDVGKEGTFALGDNEGAGKAYQLAGDYRKNLFDRTASSNYQDNVANAANNIRAGLGQAAGAKSYTDQSVINALQNMYSSVPKGGGFMKILGSLINTGSSVASSFLSQPSSNATPFSIHSSPISGHS